MVSALAKFANSFSSKALKHIKKNRLACYIYGLGTKNKGCTNGIGVKKSVPRA